MKDQLQNIASFHDVFFAKVWNSQVSFSASVTFGNFLAT